MEKIFFITDLDRTIIHSKHRGYKCVEKLGDKEITYMTDYAYDKLQELLKREEFIFIPCTMRNINQTLRVDFIRDYNPQIIICTNGAQIYIDGKLDEAWDKQMKSLCNQDELNENINYLEKLKKEYKERIGVIEIRNIEDSYITVKCIDSYEAEKLYNIINNKFGKNINVLRIEAKIFIIHNRINKVYAVDYIIERFNIKKLITSGDTEVDREFTSRGITILPKHSSFKHEKAIITEKSKIHATEEILDYINKMDEIDIKNNPEEELDVLILKANNFLNVGEFEKSKEYFKKALEILDKEKNKTELASIYLTISEIYKSVGKLDRSLEYSQRVYDIKKSDEDEYMMKSLFRIIETYISNYEYDMAKKYCKIALASSIKNKNRLLKRKPLGLIS